MTIRETQMKIGEVINESGLAIDVIELLLKDMLQAVHEQVNIAYALEKQAREKQEAEEAETKKKGAKSKGSDNNG